MSNNHTIEEIERALSEIRPFLKSDGGDISFIEYTPERIVKVQLHGACTGCSVNQMTLKSGVETTIKKYVPEVVSVEQVTAS